MRSFLKAGRKPGLFFTLFCGLGPAAGGSVEPYLEIETLAFADPVPIEEFRKDWAAPRKAGGDALLHARLESGVRIDRWSLGFIQRTDYELQASEDAAALYHRARNHASFEAGERFDLDVAAWHLESRGLRVGYRFGLGAKAWLDVAGSVLEGQAMTDGHIAGSAVAVAENDYDYEAQVDYRYSEDALFDRTVGRPYGRGFSTDVALAGSAFEHLEWRVEARDLMGRMRWESAPDTRATASSDNKEYDADGYVRYNPALSGQEGHVAFDQRIHARGSAEAVWRLERIGYGARLRLTEVRSWPSLLAQGAWVQLRWELEAMPRERALGAGVSWRGLTLRWQADNLDADNAHFLSASLGLRHVFR